MNRLLLYGISRLVAQLESSDRLPLLTEGVVRSSASEASGVTRSVAVQRPLTECAIGFSSQRCPRANLPALLSVSLSMSEHSSLCHRLLFHPTASNSMADARVSETGAARRDGSAVKAAEG